jgi:hypothetical protein
VCGKGVKENDVWCEPAIAQPGPGRRSAGARLPVPLRYPWGLPRMGPSPESHSAAARPASAWRGSCPRRACRSRRPWQRPPGVVPAVPAQHSAPASAASSRASARPDWSGRIRAAQLSQPGYTAEPDDCSAIAALIGPTHGLSQPELSQSGPEPQVSGP